jgi:adenylate cyclase
VDKQLSQIKQWFIAEALNGQGAVRTGERLCEMLRDSGVPISRGHVLVLFLHPLYHGRSFIWSQEQGIRQENWPHGLQDQPGWRDSVFYALVKGNAADRLHFDLKDPSSGSEFPMMQDMRSEGVTDYIAFRMCFSDGSIHAASFATVSPSGFSESDRELLYGLERLMTIRLENVIRRELSSTILGAYLGRNAAEHVLAGRIRREDMETISAAVWMSDLRGFTALSDRLPAEELLALLGDYFTVVVNAVREAGGEVLKFIGDAVLAVFRVTSDSSAQACEAAIQAARSVEAALVELNEERQRLGQAQILHGVGLHIGEVNYGNVGSPDRLDFTVIGPAVNMTSRIEALCSRLDQTVLMSEKFADEVSSPTACLGSQHLKGIDEPVNVYGLP